MSRTLPRAALRLGPFAPMDYAADAPSVAVISHPLWQTRFNGDAGILGRHFESFAIDRPDEIGVFTIVGVLPEQHWHTLRRSASVHCPRHLAPRGRLRKQTRLPR